MDVNLITFSMSIKTCPSPLFVDVKNIILYKLKPFYVGLDYSFEFVFYWAAH